jgi:hypothetical protein
MEGRRASDETREIESHGDAREAGIGGRDMAAGLLSDGAVGASSIMLISGLLAGFLIFGLFLAMLASTPRSPR